MGLIIVIAVIVVIFIGVGGYFLFAYLKGSIKFIMLKNSFESGEFITAELELKTKKPVEGNRFFVALIAKEIVKDVDVKGRTSNRTHEIFRFEQTLEGEKKYPSNYSNKYNIQIPVPQSQQILGNNNTSNSIVNSVIKNLSRFSSKTRQIKWVLEARLDASGVDLCRSERIYINLTNNQSSIQDFQKMNN